MNPHKFDCFLSHDNDVREYSWTISFEGYSDSISGTALKELLMVRIFLSRSRASMMAWVCAVKILVLGGS